MYWIDKLLVDFQIKSVYQLSKMTGIRESSFSSMQKRKSDYKNVKYGNMQLIASALDISMDELNNWLISLYKEEKPTPDNK
ncbi:XRE family transcriptional regulator [Listeria monocytogenes]|uniref:XRE family transcriptional regulator n=1 Tax=Listeria monocytogenes TaxID=1639 RepID=A0A823DFQ5_LISMN|nr:XRE family transcriptional regulator [Listeria monocytogenes]EAD1012187.1 XRE family transcriptional regulator [Listeria monocytogenes]EAD1186094.1 XRE family transcriptional regulator [Listeria monocytogenes]EAF8898013.1 XRE family transcriptional regulator [Listeria monocytogenes]